MSLEEQNLISHSLIGNHDCDSGIKMGENNQYLYLNCEITRVDY